VCIALLSTINVSSFLDWKPAPPVRVGLTALDFGRRESCRLDHSSYSCNPVRIRTSTIARFSYACASIKVPPQHCRTCVRQYGHFQSLAIDVRLQPRYGLFPKDPTAI
jgi:hypothetical protein